MGQVLLEKLKGKVDLSLYDKAAERLAEITIAPASQVQSIADFKDREIIILAVPDAEVLGCVRELNALKAPLVVVNIATNITQSSLEETAEQPLECIGVKIIGQARQMALGERPFIVVDDRKSHLLPRITELFTGIGNVASGNSDQVAKINNLAAKAVLEACVSMEQMLIKQGITNPEIIKSAISQVGAGTMKAYAEGDLGPFARDIVAAIQNKA
jgi:hypothetical protein